MNMEKKGLSSVIATVLLLLLTVAAVAVLSQIVIPFVKDRLYGSTDCLKYQNAFSFEPEVNGINLNCYDSKNYALSIKAESGINESDNNLKGFQISFQNQKSSEIFVIDKQNGLENNIWVLGDSSSGPHYPSQGDVISYGFSLNGIYDKAEVRPVLSNGKICSASDSVKLGQCALPNGISIEGN